MKNLNGVIEILKRAEEQCWLSGFDFSILMQ